LTDFPNSSPRASVPLQEVKLGQGKLEDEEMVFLWRYVEQEKEREKLDSFLPPVLHNAPKQRPVEFLLPVLHNALGKLDGDEAQAGLQASLPYRRQTLRRRPWCALEERKCRSAASKDDNPDLLWLFILLLIDGARGAQPLV
jgi:hypothetical protein